MVLRRCQSRSVSKGVVVASAAVLGACAYNAIPSAQGPSTVYSSYSDKVPGRYFLVIEGPIQNIEARISGINCSAHSYPLEISNALQGSIIKTLQQTIEEVTYSDSPKSADQMQALGYDGQILIRAEGAASRLSFATGFLDSNCRCTY